MCLFIYQFMDIRIVFILRLLLIQLLCDLALKFMLLTFMVMSPQWRFCEHSGTHLHVDRYFYFSSVNICECFCWAAWVYAYFVRKCPPFSTLAVLFCVPISHKNSSCSKCFGKLCVELVFLCETFGIIHHWKYLHLEFLWDNFYLQIQFLYWFKGLIGFLGLLNYTVVVLVFWRSFHLCCWTYCLKLSIIFSCHLFYISWFCSFVSSSVYDMDYLYVFFQSDYRFFILLIFSTTLGRQICIICLLICICKITNLCYYYIALHIFLQNGIVT